MVGGWQMVNASPGSWDQILKGMRVRRIPVIWCGHAHRPGGDWDGEVRVVLAIGEDFPAPDSVSALIEQNTSASDEEEGSFKYFRYSIAYGMSEAELQSALDAINKILRQNGEPETPLNIEGGKDYDAIGRPYQTDGGAQPTTREGN